MKRLAIAASVAATSIAAVLGVAVPAANAANPGIVGTFSASVTNDGALLDGVWTIAFTGHSYDLKQANVAGNGTVEKGKINLRDANGVVQIAFHGQGCGLQVGVYDASISGGVLTLGLVTDTCADREAIFAHPFTLVQGSRASAINNALSNQVVFS